MTVNHRIAKKLKGQGAASKSVHLARRGKGNTVISEFLTIRISPS